MKWIKNIYRKLTGKQIYKSRKVTKAKFVYYYVIFGAIASLLYFITSLILRRMDIIDLHWHWSFTPIYLMVAWYIGYAIRKNRKLIWIYITDVDQGKLLMYLNEYTHFSEEHKMRLINWVYLKRGTIRLETFNKIQGKILDKEEVSPDERSKLKLRPVICPQQLRDGWNEAMLINTLIFAHRNINRLDSDIREIMNLTDNNILAFDINKEAEKARSRKYQKMMEAGKKASEKLKEE